MTLSRQPAQPAVIPPGAFERSHTGPTPVSREALAIEVLSAPDRATRLWERFDLAGSLAEENGRLRGELASAERALDDALAENARLTSLAHTDWLTGLANRAALEHWLGTELPAAIAAGRSGIVLYIDLDRFKAVNDRFGHQVGDLVLRAVGERLRTAAREGDLVARLDGDEFAILLADRLDARRTAGLARRIMRAICQPFVVLGEPVSIGVSIGLASYPGDATDPVALVRAAETAMYVAKRSGGGLVVYEDRLMMGVGLRSGTRLGS